MENHQKIGIKESAHQTAVSQLQVTYSPLQQIASASDHVQHIAQLAAIANNTAPIQRQSAQGGLPGQLKSGIESLSGLAMDDVRVHYNSNKPAQLQAHAYAQGSDIHIAPGQERHLPHEAWHVVQQKQGRVKPTLQLKGIAVNDDTGLEREADVMGGRAIIASGQQANTHLASIHGASLQQAPMQLKGNPPYRKEVSLQTKYVMLAIKHTNERVSEAEADDYEVMRFQSIARPPAFLRGKKMGVQGQHKVAWVAIWTALSRCLGKKLDPAIATMQDIIDQSGVEPAEDKYDLSVVSNLTSPRKADRLIDMAHNYLVAKQQDDPSWEAQGDAVAKHAQLSGKGEVALRKALLSWQEKVPADFGPNEIGDWMSAQGLGILFDTTDREDDELEDVCERAKIELKIHNPVLYAAKKAEIDAWVES